jgi:hypothetical protein
MSEFVLIKQKRISNGLNTPTMENYFIKPLCILNGVSDGS